MNVTAGIGTAVTTKIRSQRFLEKVNQEYFAPRGLRALICKDKDLEGKLGPTPSMNSLEFVVHIRLLIQN